MTPRDGGTTHDGRTAGPRARRHADRMEIGT